MQKVLAREALADGDELLNRRGTVEQEFGGGISISSGIWVEIFELGGLVGAALPGHS
jgi:hypothetical protein